MFAYFRRISLMLVLAASLPFTISPAHADKNTRHQPFVHAYDTSGDYAAAVGEVVQKLASNGFTVVGQYSPYEGLTVIGVTNDELLAAAAETDRGGFGAAQRVSVSQVGDQIQVSYTNPVYMGLAYRYETSLAGVRAGLESALGAMEDYGTKKGIKEGKLPKYRYMFGMERFDSKKTVLAEYGSHEEAVAAVEAGLAENAGGAGKVWRVDVPGTEQVLYGVALSNECSSDAFIMGEIDFKDVKSAAHLPYEILVSGDQALGLFARYRIAINFPDLSMMGSNSFMDIMCAQGDIRDALRAAAGNPKK